MKIKPSKVVLLECKEETSVRRLQERRIDPVTGIYYNKDSLPSHKEI